MALDQEKLRQGLIQDIAQAQAVAGSARMASGSPQISQDESFAPRALRAQGRTVGEKELRDNQKAFGDAIENLLSQTSITDKLEQDKFRSGLKKKFNQLQMLALKKAGDLRVEMQRQGIEASKQEAISNAFGDLMGNLGQGLITNLGRTGGGGGQSAAPGVAAEREMLGGAW